MLTTAKQGRCAGYFVLPCCQIKEPCSNLATSELMLGTRSSQWETLSSRKKLRLTVLDSNFTLRKKFRPLTKMFFNSPGS